MQFLYRLTIKGRLLFSSFVFLGAVFFGSILIWNFMHTLTKISSDNQKVELANSQIQKAIRSLNEYVLSEGSEIPQATTLATADQFRNTCLILAKTTDIPGISSRIEESILPHFYEIESLLSSYFHFNGNSLADDEAMIVLGQILGKSDHLMEELENLRSLSLTLVESKKHGVFLLLGGTCLTILLLSIFGQWLIYTSILNPVNKLSKFSLLLAGGVLDQRIDYEAKDELSVLANSFNNMAASLSETLVSKSFLNAVIQSMQESVLFVSKSLVIERVNLATLNLLGYTEAEIVGLSLSKIIDADDIVFAKLLKEGGEILFVAKNGTTIPVHFSSSHVGNSHDASGLLVCVATDITQQKSVEGMLRQNEKHLKYLAHHDYLTDLPNRLLFRDRLDQAMHMAKRSQKKVAVLLLDLDRFKIINDSLGHQLGDKLLCKVADRLKGLLRETDTISRFGGDEFAVIMPAFTREKQIVSLAEKIINSLKKPFVVENHLLYASASIGVSIYPDNGPGEEALLACADVAMYQAKNNGRNNFRFYEADMNTRARELLSLESDLRQAVEKEQLFLQYQPQVNMKTGKIVGIEALVRWQHPQRGVVPPGDFIPIAEESGLIVPIGEWVLRTACRQSRILQQSGISGIRMAVNISVRQFQEADFTQMVQRVVKESGINPRHIELELTESLLMDNTEKAVSILNTLRSLGLQLAIDDFGTGFSSLSYLKLFPINRLKIDRSFVHDAPTDANDAAIAISVIALAKNMNLEVVAEGIETEEHLRFLQQFDCDEGQGFLFSRPLPAADLKSCFHPDFQAGLADCVQLSADARVEHI